mgnify:CR=1 FL=1
MVGRSLFGLTIMEIIKTKSKLLLVTMEADLRTYPTNHFTSISDKKRNYESTAHNFSNATKTPFLDQLL